MRREHAASRLLHLDDAGVLSRSRDGVCGAKMGGVDDALHRRGDDPGREFGVDSEMKSMVLVLTWCAGCAMVGSARAVAAEPDWAFIEQVVLAEAANTGDYFNCLDGVVQYCQPGGCYASEGTIHSQDLSQLQSLRNRVLGASISTTSNGLQDVQLGMPSSFHDKNYPCLSSSKGDKSLPKRMVNNQDRSLHQINSPACRNPASSSWRINEIEGRLLWPSSCRLEGGETCRQIGLRESLDWPKSSPIRTSSGRGTASASEAEI